MNFILGKVADKVANGAINAFSNSIQSDFTQSGLAQSDSIKINSIIQPDENDSSGNPFKKSLYPKNDSSGSSSSGSSSSGSSSSGSSSGAFTKLIIILFLLYIFISSKFFTKTILSLFGKKITDSDGNTTCIGSIIQGIIFVCFYMFFVYLVNKKII